MNREDCLDKAKSIVVGEREDTYGGPENSFGRIALLWSAYLNASGVAVTLTATDVALLMDLMKTARLISAPDHADSWVDKAGYAACGCEVSTARTSP